MSTKKLQILTPIVTSVNGETGDVTIDMNKTAVGLDKVDNTSDADKPISNATQTALDAKQDKITANGLLRGDGDGNISAVSGNFLAYEPIVDVEATPTIDADTLDGKTYDNIKDYVDKKALGNSLLDNWYFGNPANQRGQTSYTGTNTYTIDRWMTDDTVTVIDGGVKVKQNGYYAVFYQYLEDSLVDAIAGKVVTYSALTTEGLMTATTQLPTSISSDWNTDDAVQGDFTLDIVKSGAGKIYIRFGSGVDGAETTIKAIKLELGTEQTLAHQENGKWVLNEIPDYGEQLRRCQRYLRPAGYSFVVSAVNGNWYGSNLFSRSEPMRAVPVIVNGDYKAQPIREVTGGQCATITNVFSPTIYGQFAIQLAPLGSTIPNYVYIDSSGFNPLLSAEL